MQLNGTPSRYVRGIVAALFTVCLCFLAVRMFAPGALETESTRLGMLIWVLGGIAGFSQLGKASDARRKNPDHD